MTIGERVEEATEALVAAFEQLTPGDLPRSAGLQAAWRDDGTLWSVSWVRELGRDLQIATAELDKADEAGSGDEGVEHVENALWRVAAAFEKLHDVVALGLGVPALTLNKNRRGIRRFESDRRENRKRLRELADAHPPAARLLELDEQIANHRFLELRDQLIHSQAPILGWRSLIWFEVGVVKNGGILGYEGSHLAPAERIQGETPPDQLYPRSISDGREVIALLLDATATLAELLRATGELPPPPVVWQVFETGEVFLERDAALAASREAAAAGEQK